MIVVAVLLVIYIFFGALLELDDDNAQTINLIYDVSFSKNPVRRCISVRCLNVGVLLPGTEIVTFNFNHSNSRKY